MRSVRLLLPLALLTLLGSLLLLPEQEQVPDNARTTRESIREDTIKKEELTRSAPAQSRPTGPHTPDSPFGRIASLAAALDHGRPVTLRTATGGERTFWMRPRRVLGEDFQITLGTRRGSVLDAQPRIYEGAAWEADGQLTRAIFAIVGGSFAAVLSGPDETVREIHTDPATGLFRHHSPAF